MNQDNPGGYGDYEPSPDDCEVQKYQVQQVSNGSIYDDVADMAQCLIDSPYVACINSQQGSKCEKPSFVAHDQCKDYRVKYCCGKPKPKCYCCPPRLPENKCQDTGCNQHFYEKYGEEVRL